MQAGGAFAASMKCLFLFAIIGNVTAGLLILIDESLEKKSVLMKQIKRLRQGVLHNTS